MTRGVALAAALVLLAGGAWAQVPARPAPAASDKPVGLRLEGTIVLRGPGGQWGTPVVDEVNRRLYLPRGPAGLTVLALDGLKLLAEVADTAGSLAVALDPESLRGFSANALETKPGGPPGTDITVFDQRGFKKLGSVKLAGVRQILYDAATKQVVAAGDDGALTLFDPVKLTVTATLALDSKLPSALAADRRGRVFVALADRDAIAVVDMVARSVVVVWRPEGCRVPVSLAYDHFAQRLLVACRGSVAEGAAPAGPAAVMLDPYTGRPGASFAVPSQVDAVIQDTQNRMLYFTSGSVGSVLSYRQTAPFRFEPVETAGTRPMAGPGAVDGRTGRLFLPSAEYVATVGGAPGSAQGSLPRVLANSFAVLVMRRLALD